MIYSNPMFTFPGLEVQFLMCRHSPCCLRFCHGRPFNFRSVLLRKVLCQMEIWWQAYVSEQHLVEEQPLSATYVPCRPCSIFLRSSHCQWVCLLHSSQPVTTGTWPLGGNTARTVSHLSPPLVFDCLQYKENGFECCKWPKTGGGKASEQGYR